MARQAKQILAKRHRHVQLAAKAKLQKDDMVKVIAGRDKGKTGRILELDRAKERAVVEGVMMVKRHTRANPSQQIQGGIAEREGSIAISNLMLLASDGQPTRVGFKLEGEGPSARLVRFARRTGERIERGSPKK